MSTASTIGGIVGGLGAPFLGLPPALGSAVLGAAAGAVFDKNDTDTPYSPGLTTTTRTMSPEMENAQRGILSGLSSLKAPEALSANFLGPDSLLDLMKAHAPGLLTAGQEQIGKSAGSPLDYIDQYMAQVNPTLAGVEKGYADTERQNLEQAKLDTARGFGTFGGTGGTQMNTIQDQQERLSNERLQGKIAELRLAEHQRQMGNIGDYLNRQGAAGRDMFNTANTGITTLANMGTTYGAAAEHPILEGLDLAKYNQAAPLNYYANAAKALSSLPGANPNFGTSTVTNYSETGPGSYASNSGAMAQGAAGGLSWLAGQGQGGGQSLPSWLTPSYTGTAAQQANVAGASGIGLKWPS